MKLRVYTAIISLCAGLAVVAIPPMVTAASAATPAADGATSATAAPSCWAIKQSYPTSVSGPYWLVTAKLVEPAQFYCDMTTDGGGWVLIGRGREGWTFNDEGQRSPSAVRDTPSGTSAFPPAALPRTTIDGLLDGGRVDALTDGIRIKRAATSTGSSYQEVRWFSASQAGWNWALGGGVILSKATINGVTYAGGNTADSMNNYNAQTVNALQSVNDDRRWFTLPWTSHGRIAGFSYGQTVTGANNPTTYFWQNTTEGHAIPFAQLFIRPRLTTSSFSAIPDAGLAAQPVPYQMNNKPEVMPWGVTGLAPRAEKVEPDGRILVLAFQQIGNRMFVGGRFANVQHGKNAPPVAQPYLAAFDVQTGEWLPDFRPTLNGRVWDMVTSPTGKLVIAGDFTNVNGVTNTAGMAALDPTTGAVDTSFVANVTRTDTSGYPAMVRAIDIQGGNIYAGGTFNGYKGGNWNPIKLSRVVKLSATTGTPVQAWKPVVLGGIVDLDVSDRGDRVYLVGYFNAVNGDTNKGYSAQVNTTNGANIPGLAKWLPTNPASSRGHYQQAVLEVGDRVYQGGAEHNAQMYSRSTYALQFAHTFRQGGDIQAFTFINGRVYVACHCNNWDYEGSNSWPTPTGYSKPNPISWIGEYDGTTFRQNVDFQPTVENGSGGEGPWALEGDTNGCLWFGGDFTQRGFTGADTDWLGAFGRTCAVEQQPPTTPADLAVASSGGDALLTWGASTDASTPVRYQVLRGDRVIAVTTNRSFTDRKVTTRSRYWVRAVDRVGNISATSNLVTFDPPAPVLATLVPAQSTWRYRADGTDLGTAWKAPGYNVSSWASGPAELGWGDGDEATTIPATAVTTYLTRDVVVPVTSAFKALRISLKRDDGAVVYVNGVEVRRDNLPDGAVTSSTPASSFISGGAEAAFTDVYVPSDVLVTGSNRVAVELHQGGANNGDASFDLAIDALGAASDTAAPTAPSLTATGQNGQVALSWAGATDDTRVEGYTLSRDGQRIAVLSAGETSFLDQGLGIDEAHSYALRAYDRAGNVSGAVNANTRTAPDPMLVPFGASWRYYYNSVPPPAGWSSNAVDPAGWPSGPAEFGFGDGDEATAIPPGTTPRPVTAYFRKSFSVTDPSRVASLSLSLVRDDGAAVYVNGVEVVRDNLPGGQLMPTTGALAGQATRAQETTPVVFAVPSSALVAGSNLIAVEVHNLDAWGGDLSFDLQLEDAG